jgi:hypothetical protein
MFRREDQLEHPNKRRVVLLIERDDNDHAQPLTAAPWISSSGLIITAKVASPGCPRPASEACA